LGLGTSPKIIFSCNKNKLIKPPVLALYNPNDMILVLADALSYGTGAVLLQKTTNGRRAVAFASHSMTEVEHSYAQIEKEALACA